MDDLDPAGLLDGLEDTAREERAELMRQTAMELALAPGVSEKELAVTYAAVAENLVPIVDQLLRIHLDNE